MKEMRKISLTNGGVTLIDARDFEKVSAYRWLHKRCRGKDYAVRTTNKTNTKHGQHVYLHRFLLGEIGPLVDHINGDGLDNRRSNLRFTDHSLNAANRPKQKNNTSGYKGVYLEKATGHWFTQLRVMGHNYRLGTFINRELAATQYNYVAEQIFGEFANFESV